MLRSFIAIVSAFVFVMGGVMLATVVATRVMLGTFIPEPGVQPTQAFLMVNLAYSLAFALSGGLLAARLAPRAPALHALILAVFLLALAAPSLMQPEPGVPPWYPAVIALIGPGGIIVGGILGGLLFPTPRRA
jgi:hypothetical protein